MNKNNGFTLIELVIVVALIGIISAIAYPSYLEQIKKSKRIDVTRTLLRLSQMQERHFSENMMYANNFATLLDDVTVGATITSDGNEYSIALVATKNDNNACDGSAANRCTQFILTGTPKAATSQAGDLKCSVFTLNHLGVRTAQNNIAVDTTNICW